MNYDIYYVNSEGQKIDFCNWPYMIYDGDILSYDWSYDSTPNYGMAGGKITSFSKSVEKKKLKISVFAQSELVYGRALDNLADYIECDIALMNPGRLYVNGNYIECYICGINPDEWVTGCNTLDVELLIAIEYPFWLLDKEYVFPVSGQISKENYKYPLKYPWRYPNRRTSGVIYQKHIKPCDFIITITGPVRNPIVKIGKLQYGFTGELRNNEYIVINSRQGFIRKYLDGVSTSQYIDIYDDRTRHNDIYHKLPRGTLNVQWTGEFAFSVVVIEERSFPKWISQA